MRYTIVLQENIDDLENEVNEKIKEGWIPQGGVCFSKSEYLSLLWAQAMTIKDDEL